MRELRTKAGLTQAQLAEKLGVQQAAVSKLESALKDHELESVLKYLHTLGADLLLAVKQGEELYQVSDTESGLLVDVPSYVQELASTAGMSPREYIQAAIEYFLQQAVSIRKFPTALLNSDDSVAVRVRERLRGRSPSDPEIISELQKCLNAPSEEDRIFALKNFFAGSISSGGTNRDSSDENDDEIELIDLAEDLLDRIDKGLELEQSIVHYETALQVYAREAFPEKWAEVQSSLANAYLKRIYGSRAENLEQSIAHYETALQVYTREAFPEKWAEVQSSLANAYLKRIYGNRAENLEQSIAHYETALQVYTREAFPEKWAEIQIHLEVADRS
jgi:transcriptional regulator with XRE-family HTH domain